MTGLGSIGMTVSGVVTLPIRSALCISGGHPTRLAALAFLGASVGLSGPRLSQSGISGGLSDAVRQLMRTDPSQKPGVGRPHRAGGTRLSGKTSPCNAY